MISEGEKVSKASEEEVTKTHTLQKHQRECRVEKKAVALPDDAVAQQQHIIQGTNYSNKCVYVCKA